MAPPDHERFSFTHPVLGPMNGLLPSPSVAQFRSVPYARVPARFRQSVLLTDLQGQSDFTSLGYACPAYEHPPDPRGGPLPEENAGAFDEFACLVCAISTPREVFAEEHGDAGRKGLPVMVYIHGGALQAGAGPSSAPHDGRYLVETSIKEGRPVVVVSIGYRLNWQGFSASKDLLALAKAHNEPAFNYGFHDQRTALRWVHAHIAGFGGDASNITIFGDSSGGASVLFHIFADEPLFKRAIVMSGISAIVKPDSLETKEKEYEALLEYCGIATDDPDRLSKLQDVPIAKLVESILLVQPNVQNVVEDETLFPHGQNYANQAEIISKREWLESFMIGDTYMEGYIFIDVIKQRYTPATFVPLYVQHLGDGAYAILEKYGITSDMDLNLFYTRCAFLLGDLLFSQPTHSLIHELSTLQQQGDSTPTQALYRYNITIRNPFPGSMFYQVPGHHFVDTLFIFGTLAHRFPWPYQVSQGEAMMKAWTSFAAGLDPWAKYSVADGEKIAILGGSLKDWDVRTRERDVELSGQSEEGPRRYAGWDTLDRVYKEVGLEKTETFVNKCLMKGSI